jgi:hypothetical protein
MINALHFCLGKTINVLYSGLTNGNIVVYPYVCIAITASNYMYSSAPTLKV